MHLVSLSISLSRFLNLSFSRSQFLNFLFSGFPLSISLPLALFLVHSLSLNSSLAIGIFQYFPLLLPFFLSLSLSPMLLVSVDSLCHILSRSLFLTLFKFRLRSFFLGLSLPFQLQPTFLFLFRVLSFSINFPFSLYLPLTNSLLCYLCFSLSQSFILSLSLSLSHMIPLTFSSLVLLVPKFLLRTLSLLPSLTLVISLTHSRALSNSLLTSLALSISLPLSLSNSRSHSLSRILSFSLNLSLSLCFSHELMYNLSESLTLSVFLSRTHVQSL